MTRCERHIEADPERVFGRLLDAEHYPDWLVGARRVRRDARWPATGGSFAHRVGLGPVEVRDRTSVRAIDREARVLELRVRARPLLVADVRFDVLAEGSGCRVRMEEVPVGPFRLAAPALAPLVRLRNERSLARLAALLHDRPDDEP